MIIAANGPSNIAAQYGAFLFKYLQIFNTVKVVQGDNINQRDLERIKYGGFMTLSQSGEDDSLIEGIKQAAVAGLTCMNVVNVEDSPITRALAELSASYNSKSPIVRDRANSAMLKKASSVLSA